MFMSWGYFVAARARRVLLVSSLLLLSAIVVLVAVGSQLSGSGFVSDESESAQVTQAVEDDFGLSGEALVFLFDVAEPVDDPAVQSRIDASLETLRDHPTVTSVQTAWSSGNPSMVSTDGRSTYAVAMLDADMDAAMAELDEIEQLVASDAADQGLDASFGGQAFAEQSITELSEEGVLRAELFAVPIALIILLFVFRSLVASGLPLVIGGITIIGATSIVFALSQLGFQSVFAANVVTMLGLGLGIDYSLFMVTRFREEIQRRSVKDAVAVTTATVGKAILFAGITVILGLAATQFFPVPALQSIGQAGMIVTAMALVFGLTVLPAMLAIIGERINAVRIGPRRSSATNGEGRFWTRVAQGVMKRPALTLASGLAVLLLVAVPVLSLNLTPGGVDMLPDGVEARTVTERLKTDFPVDGADPITVLVTLPNEDPATPDGVASLRSVVDGISTMPGVTGVDSAVSPELAQAAGWDWSSWDGTPDLLPEPVAAAMQATVHEDTALVQVTTSFIGDDAEALVKDIRALDQGPTQVKVGGIDAEAVDTMEGIQEGLGPAILFVLVGAYVILFLTFGSVLLPLKVIFMGVVSIAASLGAVVFVFQSGNLESLLNFQADGTIVAINPILIACILFGLSMDYEVLMLSRMQEEYRRTGDNTHSVATGLAKTGRVITGAAAIMVVVFGGFVLADIVVIKSLGFGLAIAVLVDATIVRGLLVPSTMRLMGRWNWWSPALLRGVVARLGMSHTMMPAVPESEPGAD